METSDKNKTMDLLLQDNTGKLDTLAAKPSQTIAKRLGDIPDNKIFEGKHDLNHE